MGVPARVKLVLLDNDLVMRVELSVVGRDLEFRGSGFSCTLNDPT